MRYASRLDDAHGCHTGRSIAGRHVLVLSDAQGGRRLASLILHAVDASGWVLSLADRRGSCSMRRARPAIVRPRIALFPKRIGSLSTGSTASTPLAARSSD